MAGVENRTDVGIGVQYVHAIGWILLPPAPPTLHAVAWQMGLSSCNQSGLVSWYVACYEAQGLLEAPAVYAMLSMGGYEG